MRKLFFFSMLLFGVYRPANAQSSALADTLARIIEREAFHLLPAHLEVYPEEIRRMSDPEARANYTYWAARAYASTEAYGKSIEGFMKVIPYYESVDSLRRLSDIYSKQALIFAHTDRLAASNRAYRQALVLAEQTGDERARARDLHNLALNYWADSTNERSLALLNEAVALNLTNQNNQYLAANYGSLAQLQMEDGNLAVADSLYQLSIRYADASDNKDARYVTLYHLGVLRTYRGDYTAAKRYLTEADSFARTNGMIDLVNSVRHGFYLLAEQRGDYAAALHYYQQYRWGEDSIAQIRDDQRIGELLVDQQRQLELTRRELQLKNLRRVGIGLTLIVLLLALVIRQRFRNQKLKLDLSNLNNQHLREDLQQKERELMGFLLSEFQRNGDRVSLIEFVQAQKKRASAKYFALFDAISRRIAERQGNERWTEFELRFARVHGDFLTLLAREHPDLTPAEKRTCALLFLQMSTKEISNLTGQTVRAVEQQRTRIRKKCGLTGSSTGLARYLLRYSAYPAGQAADSSTQTHK